MKNSETGESYDKRVLLAIIGGAMVLVLGLALYESGRSADSGSDAMTNDTSEQTEDDTVKSKSENNDVSEDYPITAPKIEPINLYGDGSQETKSITLKSGLYDIKMTHEGTSNFVVWLVNSQGTKLEALVNEVGNYDKTLGLHATNDDDYTFDVTADGVWSLKISNYTLD